MGSVDVVMVVLGTEEAVVTEEVVAVTEEEVAVTEEVVLETEGVDTRGDARVIVVDFIHPLHQNGPLV